MHPSNYPHYNSLHSILSHSLRHSFLTLGPPSSSSRLPPICYQKTQKNVLKSDPGTFPPYHTWLVLPGPCQWFSNSFISHGPRSVSLSLGHHTATWRAEGEALTHFGSGLKSAQGGMRSLQDTFPRLNTQLKHKNTHTTASRPVPPPSMLLLGDFFNRGWMPTLMTISCLGQVK